MGRLGSERPVGSSREKIEMTPPEAKICARCCSSSDRLVDGKCSRCRPCRKCGQVNRNAHLTCRPCHAARAREYLARRAKKKPQAVAVPAANRPCRKCGAVDRCPSGGC